VLHHHLKQLLGLLTSPLVIALLVALSACIGQLRGRREFARRGFAAAILIALLASTSLVGSALLAPLEHGYAPLVDPPPVHEVVVLGSDYRPAAGLTDAAALDPDGLQRIVEGVRLVRRLPGARLVLSGGAAPGQPPIAVGYAKVAASLGIAPGEMVLLDAALDTHAEAQAVAALLGTRPFLLVTSAANMRRAMALMQRAGAAPIAAPSAGDTPVGVLGSLVPSARGLSASEHALHEYEGLLAMKLGLN
jgi:uncharacterized SAM-binding protein YcdF (DUF218 family)